MICSFPYRGHGWDSCQKDPCHTSLHIPTPFLKFLLLSLHRRAPPCCSGSHRLLLSHLEPAGCSATSFHINPCEVKLLHYGVLLDSRWWQRTVLMCISVAFTALVRLLLPPDAGSFLQAAVWYFSPSRTQHPSIVTWGLGVRFPDATWSSLSNLLPDYWAHFASVWCLWLHPGLSRTQWHFHADKGLNILGLNASGQWFAVTLLPSIKRTKCTVQGNRAVRFLRKTQRDQPALVIVPRWLKKLSPDHLFWFKIICRSEDKSN